MFGYRYIEYLPSHVIKSLKMDDSTANSMSSSQELDMSSNGDSYQGKTERKMNIYVMHNMLRLLGFLGLFTSFVSSIISTFINIYGLFYRVAFVISRSRRKTEKVFGKLNVGR